MLVCAIGVSFFLNGLPSGTPQSFSPPLWCWLVSSLASFCHAAFGYNNFSGCLLVKMITQKLCIRDTTVWGCMSMFVTFLWGCEAWPDIVIITTVINRTLSAGSRTAGTYSDGVPSGWSETCYHTWTRRGKDMRHSVWNGIWFQRQPNNASKLWLLS